MKTDTVLLEIYTWQLILMDLPNMYTTLLFNETFMEHEPSDCDTEIDAVTVRTVVVGKCAN